MKGWIFPRNFFIGSHAIHMKSWEWRGPKWMDLLWRRFFIFQVCIWPLTPHHSVNTGGPTSVLVCQDKELVRTAKKMLLNTLRTTEQRLNGAKGLVVMPGVGHFVSFNFETCGLFCCSLWIRQTKPMMIERQLNCAKNVFVVVNRLIITLKRCLAGDFNATALMSRSSWVDLSCEKKMSEQTVNQLTG